MIHMISVRLKQENNRRKLHIVFAYYLAMYLQAYKYTLLRVNVQKLSKVSFIIQYTMLTKFYGGYTLDIISYKR